MGCVDGTLRRRVCGTAAAGRVPGQDGHPRRLHDDTASGRTVCFALSLSGVHDGARALRALDRAVVLLASARG